jgi:hypothetical protein
MAETEQRLLAFGPFGVSVGDGPYATFTGRQKNVTLIELTDHCIRGISSADLGSVRQRLQGEDSSFEIPYTAIVSAQLLPQPAGFGLMAVLDITYSEDEGVRERSIASFKGRIEKAFAILHRYAPQTYARPAEEDDERRTR